MGVVLKTDDGKTYRVYLNAQAKRLAKQLHGRKAEVRARVIRRGTKKKPSLWLNVKSFKAVQEDEAEPAGEGEGDDEAEDAP
jgi:hypothetical protein